MAMHQRLLGMKIKSYNFLEVIGRGSFSIVYKAYNELNGEFVAIKAVPVAMLDNPTIRRLADSEIRVMKLCKGNPNIIGIIQNFRTSKSILITMELCLDGNLEDYIYKQGRLSEDEATYFLKQILNGFKGLHEHNVIHRDFKDANVLMHKGTLKIADMGFAKRLASQDSITNTIAGTPITMAPEILGNKGSYDMKVDIWSLGVVYYKMIFGKYPYTGSSDHMIHQATKIPPNLSVNDVTLSRDAQNFIISCLTYDYQRRISWAQVYRHPLITRIQRVRYGMRNNRMQREENSNFYQKNHQIKDLSPEQTVSLTNTKQQKFMQRQKKEMDVFKGKEKEKKSIDTIIQKHKDQYLKHRNNILFVFSTILPYLNYIVEMPVNNQLFIYLLCKKTYHDLQLLQKHIKQKNNIFNLNPNFNDFVKSQVYVDIMEMINDDVFLIRMQTEQYCKTVQKADQEARTQMNLEVIAHQNWQHYIINKVSEYQFELMANLPQTIGQVKKSAILIINALTHFINQKGCPDLQKFQTSIRNMNVVSEQARLGQELKKKINSFR